jgi:hypothetical protein
MIVASRVRTAGVLGMAGGLLWIVSVVMQYGLGLFSPDGSPLRLIHELIAFAGIIGAMAGFWGLIWGQAFRGRLGPVGVALYILGWAFILIGGIGLLALGPAESPLFLVFPIGGNLKSLGAILFAIATVTSGRWSGWQRWMPLVVAAALLLTMDVPTLMGLTPDGPTMLAELLEGVVWVGLGLAVFTSARQPAGMVAADARAA